MNIVKKDIVHIGTVEGWIPLRELLFRLNIHKVSWQHHVDDMGRVPTDLMTNSPKGKISDKYTYNKGTYVKWPLAAELIMAHFQDAQLDHTHIRLRALGFDSALGIKDKTKGIVRMNNQAISDWKACVKEEDGGTDTIPRSFKNGNIGQTSMSATGAIEFPVEKVIDVTPVVKKVSPKAIASIKRDIEDIEDLDSIIGNLEDIDFSDPDEVAQYQRKAKLIKELTAAKKEGVKLAKESNASVDMDEIGRMLEAVMIAFRTTITQAVPKTTAEIHGAIVTELVRKNPTLQKHLAKIDMADLNNTVRGIFDKSMYELSELVSSFITK